MTDPVILFAKPQFVSKEDKATLAAAGVIVVEVSDVADVKLVRAHSELSGGDLLLAAAKALSDTRFSSHQLTVFGAAICGALKEKTNG